MKRIEKKTRAKDRRKKWRNKKKTRTHTTYDRNENSVMDPDIKTSHLFLLQ